MLTADRDVSRLHEEHLREAFAEIDSVPFHPSLPQHSGKEEFDRLGFAVIGETFDERAHNTEPQFDFPQQYSNPDGG